MSPAFKSWLQLVDKGEDFRRFALISRARQLLFAETGHALRSTAKFPHMGKSLHGFEEFLERVLRAGSRLERIFSKRFLFNHTLEVRLLASNHLQSSFHYLTVTPTAIGNSIAEPIDEWCNVK